MLGQRYSHEWQQQSLRGPAYKIVSAIAYDTAAKPEEDSRRWCDAICAREYLVKGQLTVSVMNRSMKHAVSTSSNNIETADGPALCNTVMHCSVVGISSHFLPRVGCFFPDRDPVGDNDLSSPSSRVSVTDTTTAYSATKISRIFPDRQAMQMKFGAACVGWLFRIHVPYVISSTMTPAASSVSPLSRKSAYLKHI